MGIEAGFVPFSYGELQGITNDANRVIFWFLSREGVIRGVPLDLRSQAPRLQMGDGEIVVKRGGTDTVSRTSINPNLSGR